MPVAVDVHELWSRGRASPNAGYFGRLSSSLQPGALGEVHPAQPFEDLDLALVELSDEEVHFAFAVQVRQARRGEAGFLNSDWNPARLQSHRRREFELAAEGGG